MNILHIIITFTIVAISESFLFSYLKLFLIKLKKFLKLGNTSNYYFLLKILQKARHEERKKYKVVKQSRWVHSNSNNRMREIIESTKWWSDKTERKRGWPRGSGTYKHARTLIWQ